MPNKVSVLVAFWFLISLVLGSTESGLVASTARAQENVQSSSDLELHDDSERYDDYESPEPSENVLNFTLDDGESLPRSDRSQAYLLEIESVLSGADFAKQETVTRRRWKDVTDKRNRDEKFPQWLIDIVKALEGHGDGVKRVAQILEILIWIFVIGLIGFVFFKYRTQFSQWVSSFGEVEHEPDLPTTLFGLDVKKSSIPDDVVNVAQEHWLKGEKREATAILLRASLIKLLHEHECRFFSSDTESECCDRIDQQVPEPISLYMRKLVDVWQRVAYAHLEPTEQRFDELCQRWREVFDAI